MRGIDLTNKIFERLEVVERAPKPDSYGPCRKAFWKCICICGNETIVMSESLRKGRVKSCGCLKSDKLSKRGFKTPALAGLKKLYRRYKSGAKRRNLEFDLTEDEFKVITSSHCTYCTSPPLQISDLGDVKGYSPERIKFGQYLYNGIDRVDPAKGYTKQNSVACCKTCNRMKADMLLQAFKDHINWIYSNLCEQVKQELQ